jgi:CPA2 family monovalent cation:H+ antiporter-2
VPRAVAGRAGSRYGHPVSLADLVLLLAVAAAGLLLGRLVRLPAIVAYLVAGVAAGPAGLGWIAQSPELDRLAELGVALLLFGVGIEFSLERLRRTLGRLVASGLLQVLGTVVLTAAAFHAAGMAWPLALFIGFLIALSSTAIVFKTYDDAGTVDAPHGLAAAGILLLQDLALVPMMLLVPILASPAEGALRAVALAIVRGTAALAALLSVARVALPRALRLVARAGTPEAFPLFALVLALGTALGANALGLSLPIGAFLAGLALSASPFAQQVFAELLPLRDASVALFFTSIGLLLDPGAVAARPALFLGMLAAVAAKGLLVALVVLLVWRSRRLAVLTGLGLMQIGEFSFVLAREGGAAGLLAADVGQAFLGTAIATMAATPFLMRLAERLAAAADRGAPATAVPLENHVLVIGYGVTGTAVARVLGETGIPFVAVDLVPEAVEAGRREGLPVRFGDATRRAVLAEMNARRARAAVVALGDPAATRRCVSLLRQLAPDLRILVRARRVGEIAELERLGADDVVPSEFETSIELFVRLLAHLGVPRHVARVQESLIRLDHYQALRGVGATPELLAKTRELVMGGILETAQVMAGSAAAGRTLAELDLRRQTGAQVLSVVRESGPLPTPDGPTRLDAGDLVVLYGPHEAIDRALHLLEPRAPGEA